MPKRIQLSRRKGYRKPEGVVNVARPTRWGNPYVVGEHPGGDRRRTPYTRETAVATFRKRLSRADVEQAIRELRGRDLACWCPLNAPCHADVLLEVANQPLGPKPVN